MNQSPDIKELAIALSAAQSEFTAVPFNATNPFLKNRYADLSAIVTSTKPILAKNHLAISQMLYSDGNSVGVTTMLMHSSGQWISSSIALPLGEEKGKSLAQVAGSIATYCRRYAYSAILGIVSDEDTDGNEPRRAEKKRQEPPAEPTSNYWGSKRAALIGRIKAIPYYSGNVPHVIASLNKLAESGAIKPEMTDDQVFAIVNDHAKQAADREAA